MQLLQSVTPLILLSFSRRLTSRGSSSRVHSAPKIKDSACFRPVTGVFSTFVLTVTTVTSNKIKGIKFNNSKGYKAVTVTTKNAATVTTLLHTVTVKM